MWKLICGIVFLALIAFEALQAHPQELDRQFNDGQNYDQFLRQMRDFDSMSLGSTFGTAKRSRLRDFLKKQKHRRGTFDSLEFGNTIGRASKRNFDANYQESPETFNYDSHLKKSSFDPLSFSTFGMEKRGNVDAANPES